MRKLLTTMSALAALALAAPAYAADGTFNLSWDSCTGPLDKTVVAANPAISLYGSVIGFDVPFKAYQVQLIWGNSATTDVPDAWRFDAPGCQGSSFITIDHLAPAAVVKTCPTLQGAVASIQIKDVSKVSTGAAPYDGDYLRLTMANATGDAVVTPVAATRYFVVRALFDHSFSVVGATTPGTDCGGVEQPICIATIIATYLDANGVEWNWGLDGNRGATANGSAGCPASPVQTSTTWGAIKSQYRN